MLFNDTLETARAVGAKAAASLARHGLAPTPAAYAVWYAHHGGHAPDLSRALGILEGNRQPVTDEACAELWLRFLAPDAERCALEDTGAGLRAALDQASEVVREAGGELGAYGRGLAEDAAGLGPSATAAQVRAVAAALAGRTAGAAARARELQGRLEEAGAQVDAMRRDLDAVRLEARTDGLTGVANRRRLDEALRAEAARAMNTDRPLALVLADVDHFKRFNDEHGHQTGDQVLRSVAGILAAGVREGDLVARYGGEEFAALMPGTTVAEAAAAAERLRAAVGRRRIVRRGSGEAVGSVTMSFGVAGYVPGEPLSALVARADAALYRAKAAGRDRVEAEGQDRVAYPGGLG